MFSSRCCLTQLVLSCKWCIKCYCASFILYSDSLSLALRTTSLFEWRCLFCCTRILTLVIYDTVIVIQFCRVRSVVGVQLNKIVIFESCVVIIVQLWPFHRRFWRACNAALIMHKALQADFVMPKHCKHKYLTCNANCITNRQKGIVRDKMSIVRRKKHYKKCRWAL